MRTGLLSISIAMMVLCGCRTHKDATVITCDSIHTEVRKETVYVLDTVYFQIPAQTSERTTSDSTSHLENDFAESIARINPDGTLFHDLRTKQQDKPVPYDKPIERKDSIVYRDKRVEVPIPVEKELGWWERTCIKWFPYTFGLCVLVLGYVFRKPIFGIVRRYI